MSQDFQFKVYKGLTTENELPPDSPSQGIPVWLYAGMFGLFFGALLGWFMNESSNARLYCTIAIAVILYGAKQARDHYNTTIVAWCELQEIQSNLKEKRETKSAAPQAQPQAAPVASSNYMFTSDDFDDTAKSMLDKPVKQARKANAKITGEGLVKTVLKGLR